MGASPQTAANGIIAKTRNQLAAHMIRIAQDWPEESQQMVEMIAGELKARGFPDYYDLRIRGWAEMEFLARHCRGWLIHKGPPLDDPKSYDWVMNNAARFTRLSDQLNRRLYQDLKEDREAGRLDHVEVPWEEIEK